MCEMRSGGRPCRRSGGRSFGCRCSLCLLDDAFKPSYMEYMRTVERAGNEESTLGSTSGQGVNELLRVLRWAVIVGKSDLTRVRALGDDLSCRRPSPLHHVERLGDRPSDGNRSECRDNERLDTHVDERTTVRTSNVSDCLNCSPRPVIICINAKAPPAVLRSFP
jgi:hypothetical protein